MSLEMTIIGNMTLDPELRFTPSGVAVANTSIACNRRKQVNGEWVDDEPVFFTVTAWRQLAEHLARSAKKGGRIIIQGRLGEDKWVGDDGIACIALSPREWCTGG